MKSSILLLVLFSISLCGATLFKVKVQGKLLCPTLFFFNANLWEKDGSTTQLLSDLKHRKHYVNATSTYEIEGTTENIKTVKPLITIEHSCGKNYACVCKEFGDVRADFEATVEINLENSYLKECSACAEARKIRGWE